MNLARISLLISATAVSIFAADPLISWDDQGAGDATPKIWYDYSYKGKNTSKKDVSVDFVEPDSTETPYVMKATFTANSEKATGGAGVGFYWKVNANYDEVYFATAANYAGVCMTYSSTAPFRMDFKQLELESNFYGTLVASTNGVSKTTFFAFEDMTQGWEDDESTIPRKLNHLLGPQFSFKGEYAKKYKVLENEVKITMFSLADECPSHAPVVKATHDAEETEDLAEGVKKVVALSDIFEDADGDDLTITVAASSKEVSILDSKESYGLTDKVTFQSMANPENDAEVTVTFTAKDPTKKTATYKLTFVLSDTENAPTAENDSYTMKEDDTLKVSVLKGVLANDFDADGDEFEAILYNPPAHGTIEEFEETGKFVYIPDSDYYGEDSFTYVLNELAREDNPEYIPQMSNPATVTITIENVDDPAELKIVDSTIYVGDKEQMLGDTIVVDEDFETFEVQIPAANVVFNDPDAQTTAGAAVMVQSKGVVSVSNVSKVVSSYVFEVSSVKNANGVAKIFLFVVDEKDSIGVNMYVKVNPVADPPVATADAYIATQNKSLEVDAKKGVLANDENPDNAKDTLTAILVDAPANGELSFNIDGSFTYTPEEDFVGEDEFTYMAVNSDEDESEVVTVTITVKEDLKPTVLVDAETLGFTQTEDFTKTMTFVRTEVESWFKSKTGGELEYSAKSDDGKLAVTMTATNSLQIKSVRDSCGDAYVTVYATDGDYTPAEIKIHVTITPVNDKPIAYKSDTIVVKELKDWSVQVALLDWIKDADGDTLTYEPILTATQEKAIATSIKGDTLTISAVETHNFVMGEKIAFSIKATDAEAATVNFKIVLFVGEGSNVIKPVLAQPSSTWQNAVMAESGKVTILDMQGRVMWSAKLPASEADVRAAAAQVQGRKILRVNKQTWTIK